MMPIPCCSRLKRRCAAVTAFLFLLSAAGATEFTPDQLNAALHGAGIQKVLRVQTFETPKAEYLLVFAGIAGGEVEIFVFRDDSLRYGLGHSDLKVDWQSGVLPKELAVTSGGMPEIEPIVNGDTVILFSGCMAHNCGGKAGAMVYSVGRHELFTAVYDSSKMPYLKYSANVSTEKNVLYKEALDSMLQDHNVKTNSK